MRTKVLPDPVLELLKRNPHVYAALRKARMAVGRAVPPRRIAGIPGRVHFNDYMLESPSPQAAEFYILGARNVLALIQESLEAAGRAFDDVDSWLDFGCGYGRVIRLLVERVERSTVFASDVVEEAVDFCVTEFGVNGLQSSSRIADLRLGRHDFVYAISVLTHLSEEDSVAMLCRLGDALNEGGILMFTTHGPWSVERASLYSRRCGTMKDEIARRVDQSGMAFVPYGHYVDDAYGLTWHSEQYIFDRMRDLHGAGMRRLFISPRGLDDDQDVFCYQRVAS